MLRRLTDERVIIVILLVIIGLLLVNFVKIFSVLDFIYLLIIASYVIKYFLLKIKK